MKGESAGGGKSTAKEDKVGLVFEKAWGWQGCHGGCQRGVCWQWREGAGSTYPPELSDV